MSERPATDELLAAYVDGVAELAPAERRAVEARLAEDPAMRAGADDARALIGRLRELSPAAGTAPDWSALERRIGASVDEAGPPPRPWWRRWTVRWLAPAGALAVAAAIAVVVVRSEPAAPTAPAPPVAAAPTAPAPAPLDAPTVALWLDGDGFEVELDAEALLDVPWDGPANEDDLLPAADLAWIDELDSEQLERAVAFLDAERS